MEDKPIWETFEIAPLNNFKGEEYSIRNFQQYAIYLSLSMSHYILGLQTGLGKTLCAYASYYYYKEKYPNTKLIVVSNKSSTLQMEEQLYKFFHVKERGVVIHNFMDRERGEKYADARKRVINQFGEVGEDSIDILWMGYSILRIHKKQLRDILIKLKLKDYKLFVIYDESTAFLNLNTKIFYAVSAVSRISDKVYSLTATISKGKLKHIYSIFKAMGIPVFPNKAYFEERYCDIWQHPKIHYIKTLRGYKNVQELVELVRPYIVVFRKADVASQLPKFTINKVFLGHSEKQVRFISSIYSGEIDVMTYNKQDASYEEKRKSLKSTVETNLIKMSLLDHRTVSKIGLDIYSEMSPKTEEIIRMFKEDFDEEKVVIYTHSKRYLELLKQTIMNTPKMPDKYKKVLVIHGGISARDREKNKRIFSDSKDHNIMILNNAGIESLNLQAANTIIVTTMPFDFGGLTQLAGRISRLDTKHDNLHLIFLLIKDSQDEDEYEIVMQQGALMDHITGEPEEGLIDYSVLTSKNNISVEEYKSRSLVSLVLSHRRKRANLYKTKLLKRLN